MENTPVKPTYTHTTDCSCGRCVKSRQTWVVGVTFEAVSFGLKHWMSEEAHSSLASKDPAVIKVILKHVLKRQMSR